MNENGGGVTVTSVRRRAAVVLAVIGLGAIGLAAPAGAAKSATPSHKAGQVPADDITGQDHPADVFVEYFQYIPSTVHVKKGGHIKFGNYDMFLKDFQNGEIIVASLTDAAPRPRLKA